MWCEFEVNDKKMAVVGDRELAFFLGIYYKLAFFRFICYSKVGVCDVEL